MVDTVFTLQTVFLTNQTFFQFDTYFNHKKTSLDTKEKLFYWSNTSYDVHYRPRTVLNALKKKLTSPNPHSALYALLVLESIVKNCGK